MNGGGASHSLYYILYLHGGYLFTVLKIQLLTAVSAALFVVSTMVCTNLGLGSLVDTMDGVMP